MKKLLFGRFALILYAVAVLAAVGGSNWIR